MVACTAQTENKPVVNTQMASAVNEEQTFQLKALRSEFAELGGRELISRAKSTTDGPSACVLYDKYAKYGDIQRRFQLLGISEGDFEKQISSSLDSLGPDMADAAYNQMKAGRALNCSGDVPVKGTYAVKTFAELIDKFGPEGADPKVIRTAYLKAIKGEVQETLAELKQRPDSGDLQGLLIGTAEEAKEWQFTAMEIGIPADIAKKLQL